jgi:hypothetical protein
LEKVACGLRGPPQMGQRFSDINSVAAPCAGRAKKRGFCRLRSMDQRKSDRLLVPADIGAFLNFRKVPSHRAGFS